MRYLKKGLAVLLSIIMMLSLCGFADPAVEEEHSHEQGDETIVVTDVSKAVETVSGETEEHAIAEINESAIEEVEATVADEAKEPTTGDTEESEAGKTEEPEIAKTGEPAAGDVEEPAADEAEKFATVETDVPVIDGIEGEEPAAGEAEEPVIDGTEESVNGEQFTAVVALLDEAVALSTDGDCEHTSTEEHISDMIGRTTIQVKNITDAGHTLVCSEIYVTECRDCGATLSYRINIEEITEEHNYSDLFGDSHCWNCGYVCKHKNTSWENAEKSNEAAIRFVDGKTHEVTVKTNEEVECLDCGTWLQHTVEAPVVTVVPHEFDEEGYCSECGYWRTGTCAHEHISTERDWIEEEDGAIYREENGECYLEEAWVTYRDYCDDCGDCLNSYQQFETNLHIKETHIFAEGGNICVCCGYENACKHENVVTAYNDMKWGDALDNGDGTHTYPSPSEKLEYCLDCGAVLSDEYVERYTIEGHYYNRNGVCEYCGAIEKNKCMHPNEQSFVVTQCTSGDGEYIDNSLHRVTVTKREVTNSVCPDCGSRRWNIGDSNVVDTYSSLLPHETDDDGYCWICKKNIEGAGGSDEDSDTCNHDRTSTEEGLYVKYFLEEGDENGHKAVYYEWKNIWCEDCDDWLGERRSPIRVGYLPHNWNADGVCEECGYVNPCKHPNLVTADSWTDVEMTSIVNEGYHSMVMGKYEVVECPDCGYIDEIFAGIEPQQKQERHTLENGCCEICGYISKCEHSSMEKSFEDRIEYEWISDRYHIIHNVSEKTGLCADCCAMVVLEHTDTQTKEAHVYDDVLCPCGAVNASLCDHPEEFIIEVEVDGMRETRYIPVTGNVAVHSVEIWTQYQEYCELCEQLVGEPFDLEPVRTLNFRTVPHTFVDGVCATCGFKQTCTHVYATSDAVTEFVRYDVTAAGHVKVSKVTTTTTCPDCDSVTTKTQEIKDEAEAHTWEKGICTFCKYECQHPEDEREYGEATVEKSYDAEDDSTHVPTTTTTTPYACGLCGEPAQDVEVVKGDAEKHTYVKNEDGAYICEVCEHECGHESTNVDVVTEFDRYDITVAEHVEVSKVTTTTTCPDCSSVTTEIAEVKAEAEAHAWENGVCTVCEYECLHETTSDEVLHEILDYEEIDDEYHYELGNEFIETSCDVCGVVTNVTELVDWISEQVEHTYADGVCIECGHVCTHADHEVEEDVFVVKSYASVNGSEHAVTGDIHHVVSCGLCGAVLSDEMIQQSVVVNEKHVFSGRKCTLCGYTKPVQKDETPVVEDEQIFNEVPADEVVHGISVADNLRMAVALVRALRGIEAEYGEDVEIDIENIEMILTETELEKLDALLPEERIIVLLNVIDYENEINIATVALEIELSDEAQALIDEIAARIEAMDESTRTEFDANVKAAYPVVKVESDGVVADQIEVIIALKFREGNAYRLERYTFRCDNGAWYFISLAN